MSTQYDILKKGGLTITLDEHSSVFGLCIDAEDAARMNGVYGGNVEPGEGEVTSVSAYTPEITPADLVGMAFEMLKVASYQMDDDEFVATARTLLKDKGLQAGYYRDLVRQLDEASSG